MTTAQKPDALPVVADRPTNAVLVPADKLRELQEAEPTDVQMEQIADAIWGAQKKRLPMSAAIQFARDVLALKTAQTTALPGGDGEGE